MQVSAALIIALLEACQALTLLTTSREPIGVTGEVTWRVPSLSLADEAVELFTDRARLTRPDFVVTDDNVAVVMEICRRLDGMPLAVELAGARVRALSLAEILDGLHDRFRLLTGGSRTAVRRQQTLRASVEWSHALLTEPERVLFRRLAAFMGGFDLDAAQAVAGGGDVEHYQVLDLLTLLVDKSLVVAEDSNGRTRYRLLETVRQYALEKLGESGEADAVRAQHRDHYTSMAALLGAPARSGRNRLLERAETEIDNLRAAFAWSRENSEIEGRGAYMRGDPIAVRAAAEEGRELADAIGDRFNSRLCRWCLAVAQMTQGDLAKAAAQFRELVAEADAAHDVLTCAADVQAHLAIPDVLECLATVAGDVESHREAARLFGAAYAMRHRMGSVRFKVDDVDYYASVASARTALGDRDFESAWAEGAALSTEEAIAYAQRGRGERKRPSSGWASLTPTELDVVRLVSEGLANKDIATRLFVSPRTVQTHLTHVYTKLGLTSRVQLAQEAARRT